MPEIIGVGESDVDVYLQVDHPPRRGEKVCAREIGKLPGGMIGNFCAGVAKHGVSCGIVSVVGDDENGKIALADYQGRGIDTAGLTVEPGKATFYCVVHIDGTGEKCLTAVQTPLMSPRPEQVPADYIRRAKYVHVNSMDYTLALHVAKTIAGSGAGLSLDYEAHAEHPGFDAWKPVLEQTSVLFVNEDGLESLLPGLTMDQAAERILPLGVQYMVITCAEKGGAVFTKDQSIQYRAYRAAHVADTTGAGDCFNAAFLSEIVRGSDPKAAARYAAAASTISIGAVGARTGLPAREQVLAFLAAEPEQI